MFEILLMGLLKIWASLLMWLVVVPLVGITVLLLVPTLGWSYRWLDSWGESLLGEYWKKSWL